MSYFSITIELILNWIGANYSETESDLLLLDISNNAEYKWTTQFEYTPPGPPTDPTSSPSPNNAPIIGIGTFIGSISLAFGVLFLI